jgi:hypothetical protein
MKLNTEKNRMKDLLNEGKKWECYHATPEMVKAFISSAYNGIDFDTNFELREIKTVFGTKIVVRKK